MSEPVDVRAGAAPRLLRAAVFTAVCVVLSALGHVVAACAPVSGWSLVLGFLGTFVLVAPLAGRPRSTATVVAALTAGQLALHTVFGLGQRHLTIPRGSDDALIRTAAKLLCGGGSTSLSPADAARIVADAGISPATVRAGAAAGGGADQAHQAHQHLLSASSASGALAPDGLLPSLPMVLAHLLAALATGWLLRRGDLALLRLAQLSVPGIGEVTDGAPLRALRAALSLVRALGAGLPGVPAPGARAAYTPCTTPPTPSGEALQHTVIRRGPPGAHTLSLAA
ncbi:MULTISPECIES: hypothetical protein [unclassified Streptomyces]|uniref:hypothetical protein n=1 Tax=unclassified Streptomyces TaxID=2593676 RepID=UPI0004C6A3FC|nr:hypothetical protein [Streptomyces sp. NRRL F-5135]